MNLHELFEKLETEFLAGHEKIKTELDFELFVGKLSEQILGDVYSLTLFIKLGVIILKLLPLAMVTVLKLNIILLNINY